LPRHRAELEVGEVPPFGIVRHVGYADDFATVNAFERRMPAGAIFLESELPRESRADGPPLERRHRLAAGEELLELMQLSGEPDTQCVASGTKELEPLVQCSPVIGERLLRSRSHAIRAADDVLDDVLP
jgi:hypothetical protein